MTDLKTIEAPVFGRTLTGIGLNLLVTDVRKMADFLTQIIGCTAERVSADFAIIRYRDQIFQLHQDGTYSSNPLLSILPESGMRGAGAELRFFETDPDEAARQADSSGGMVLQAPTDKPHGLRECYILGPDGYCFVVSKRLAPKPGDADYTGEDSQ